MREGASQCHANAVFYEVDESYESDGWRVQAVTCTSEVELLKEMP